MKKIRIISLGLLFSTAAFSASIQKSFYGYGASGAKVDRYVLKNDDGMSVGITNYRGIICRCSQT